MTLGLGTEAVTVGGYQGGYSPYGGGYFAPTYILTSYPTGYYQTQFPTPGATYWAPTTYWTKLPQTPPATEPVTVHAAPTGGTEAVTVPAAATGGIQPSFSPGYLSPSFTPGEIYNPSVDIGGGTEAVTVGASPAPYQIQAPNFAPYFQASDIANTPPPAVTPPGTTPPGTTENVTVPGTPTTPPIHTPPITPPPLTTGQLPSTPPYYPFTPAGQGTEAVQVSAVRPQQHFVHTPVMSPNFGIPNLDFGYWQFPAITPMGMQPAKKPPAKKPGGGGGGGGGGASMSPKPPPPKPPTPQQPPPRPPLRPQAQPISAQQPQPVTPAQKAALAALTPDQLRQLLQDPNLTPAQKAAVAQALNNATRNLLAARRAAPRIAAGGGGGGGAAVPKAPGAVSAASPLQPASLMIPLLIAAGVATAYAATHHKQVATATRSTVRRVRKAIAA